MLNSSYNEIWGVLNCLNCLFHRWHSVKKLYEFYNSVLAELYLAASVACIVNGRNSVKKVAWVIVNKKNVAQISI